MNEQVLAYLPVLSPIATLLVVMLGIFFSNRHVDVRVSDLNKLIDVRFSDLHKLMQAEIGRLEAIIKSEVATLRLDIQRVEHRLDSLEMNAG